MAKDIEFADDTTSFAHTQQFQDIKNAAHQNDLAHVIGVVIGDEQGFAKYGLPGPVGNAREEIGLRIGD